MAGVGMPRRISAPRLVRHREIRVRATPALPSLAPSPTCLRPRAIRAPRRSRSGSPTPPPRVRAGDTLPSSAITTPRHPETSVPPRPRGPPAGSIWTPSPPRRARRTLPLLRAHPHLDGFAISKPPATFSGPPAPPLPPRPRARSRPSSPLRSIQRLPPPLDRRGATSPRTPWTACPSRTSRRRARRSARLSGTRRGVGKATPRAYVAVLHPTSETIAVDADEIAAQLDAMAPVTGEGYDGRTWRSGYAPPPSARRLAVEGALVAATTAPLDLDPDPEVATARRLERDASRATARFRGHSPRGRGDLVAPSGDERRGGARIAATENREDERRKNGGSRRRGSCSRARAVGGPGLGGGIRIRPAKRERRGCGSRQASDAPSGGRVDLFVARVPGRGRRLGSSSGRRCGARWTPTPRTARATGDGDAWAWAREDADERGGVDEGRFTRSGNAPTRTGGTRRSQRQEAGVKAQPPRATLASVLADAGARPRRRWRTRTRTRARWAPGADGGISDWSPPRRERLVGGGDGVVFARVRGDRFPRGETTPRDRGDRGGGARAGRREPERHASRISRDSATPFAPRRWPRRDPTRPSSTRRSARAGRRRFVDLPRPSRSPPPSSSRTPRRRSRRGTIRSGPSRRIFQTGRTNPSCRYRFTGRRLAAGTEAEAGGAVGVGDGDRDGDGDDVARVSIDVGPGMVEESLAEGRRGRNRWWWRSPLPSAAAAGQYVLAFHRLAAKEGLVRRARGGAGTEAARGSEPGGKIDPDPARERVCPGGGRSCC